jgi:hypothetical protein
LQANLLEDSPSTSCCEMTAASGTPAGAMFWNYDSEWYNVGMRSGPLGAPWADKAIRAREMGAETKARAYANKALAVNRTAWLAWYEAFTGIPLTPRG